MEMKGKSQVEALLMYGLVNYGTEEEECVRNGPLGRSSRRCRAR